MSHITYTRQNQLFETERESEEKEKKKKAVPGKSIPAIGSLIPFGGIRGSFILFH